MTYDCKCCTNGKTAVCKSCFTTYLPSGDMRRPTEYTETVYGELSERTHKSGPGEEIARKIALGNSVPLALVAEYNKRLEAARREPQQ